MAPLAPRSAPAVMEDPSTPSDFTIHVAGPEHYGYAEAVCRLIEDAAQARGTGIAKRQPAYVRAKMEEGKAVIALWGDRLAGFCYIETWDHGRYVANSGLIVAPDFRKRGLAKRIKRRAFELSREKYPQAKLFGITTSLAVMKINTELGYEPVTFSELTTDDVFWKGCQSCPNYDVLTRTNRKLCLCTGMLFDPNAEPPEDGAQEG
ncbi:MAG: GNAT family N-acetyltransferase [Rhodothermales bacterium]|nr:GNAT family N-acetyltransferase [Rhodothermales bacterium]